MDLAARLKKEGFSISAKSIVVASSEALAKRIVKELGNEGLTLPVSQAGQQASKNYWNRIPISSPFPVTEPFLERAKRSWKTCPRSRYKARQTRALGWMRLVPQKPWN